MKKRTKTNLKIAGATSMCLFALTSLFTGTIAWFSSNQSVSGSGMSVTVDPGSQLQILSCYAVRYDGNYGAIAIDVSSGNENITMSEYDYIFTDRNVNTPLFIRMEISGFDSTKDLTVNIPCSGSYKNGNVVEPYLSNVVSAKFMRGIKVNGTVVPDANTWTGNNQTTAPVINSYNGMLAHAADDTGTPFVNGNSKVDSVTLTLNAAHIFDQNYIFTKQDANQNNINYVVAFVVLDYHVTNNVNLVTSYLDSYEGQGIDHSLSFTSDIQRMMLRNEGGNE